MSRTTENFIFLKRLFLCLILPIALFLVLGERNRIFLKVIFLTCFYVAMIYMWYPIIDKATRRIIFVFSWRSHTLIKMPPVASEKRFCEIVRQCHTALLIGLGCVAVWPGIFAFILPGWPYFPDAQRIVIALIFSLLPVLIYFMLREVAEHFRIPEEYKSYVLPGTKTFLDGCRSLYLLGCFFVAVLWIGVLVSALLQKGVF